MFPLTCSDWIHVVFNFSSKWKPCLLLVISRTQRRDLSTWFLRIVENGIGEGDFLATFLAKNALFSHFLFLCWPKKKFILSKKTNSFWGGKVRHSSRRMYRGAVNLILFRQSPSKIFWKCSESGIMCMSTSIKYSFLINQCLCVSSINKISWSL